MKSTRLFAFTFILILAATSLAADAKRDVQSAVRSLEGKSSYSWVSVPQMQGRDVAWQPGETRGQAERGGLVYFILTSGNNTLEAAIKGRKSAMKLEGDWESSDHLIGERAWLARRLQEFKAPAAEAEDLLAKSIRLSVHENGLYTGELTALGARELLLARSRSLSADHEPLNPRGNVKFWVEGGVLKKYEYELQALMPAGLGQRRVDVQFTNSVEIREINSTKINLPAAARKLL